MAKAMLILAIFCVCFDGIGCSRDPSGLRLRETTQVRHATLSYGIVSILRILRNDLLPPSNVRSQE